MPRHARPDPGHLKAYIDSFILDLRIRNRSPRTQEMYRDAVSWFAGWTLERRRLTGWEDITRDDLKRFFLYLHDQGYAASYMNNVGRCLQQYFKWFAAEEQLPNPYDRFTPPPPPKIGEKVVPVLSVEDMTALLKDAESGRDFESRRDAAILRLFACTGVRLSELALMQADAVDIPNRTALVTGKGSKQRHVKFDFKCAQALDRYMRVRSRHPAVTKAGLTALWVGVRRRVPMTPSGVRQVIERRGEKLGLDIHPHMFRHTFSHNWLDAGGAEGDLMELNGWESPQMLRHYGASARSARARRAYDRINVMRDV
jgi:integrase/recombinase XerD